MIHCAGSSWLLLLEDMSLGLAGLTILHSAPTALWMQSVSLKKPVRCCCTSPTSRMSWSSELSTGDLELALLAASSLQSLPAWAWPHEKASGPQKQHSQSTVSGLRNCALVRQHLEGASLCVSASFTQSVHSPEKKNNGIFFCTVLVNMSVCWLCWFMTSVKYLVVSANWNPIKSRLWKECLEQSCLDMLSEIMNCC